MSEANQAAQQAVQGKVLLVVDIAEAEAIINTLGKLPTEANAWPLRQRLIEQTNKQVGQQQAKQPVQQAVTEAH